MREGAPLPARIRDAPQLRLGLELYYEAFSELSSCRASGFGPSSIPWTAVKDYALAHELDEEQTEMLMHHIRAMDDAYLIHAKKRSEKNAK